MWSLSNTYQGVRYEDNLKYGGRDVSESSCVFCGSKDCKALVTDHYFHNPQTKNLHCYCKIKIKDKRPSVVSDRSLLSYEMFVAVKGPKPNTIFMKVL